MGTLGYLAPEAWHGRKKTKNNSEPTGFPQASGLVMAIWYRLFGLYYFFWATLFFSPTGPHKTCFLVFPAEGSIAAKCFVEATLFGVGLRRTRGTKVCVFLSGYSRFGAGLKGQPRLFWDPLVESVLTHTQKPI